MDVNYVVMKVFLFCRFCCWWFPYLVTFTYKKNANNKLLTHNKDIHQKVEYTHYNVTYSNTPTRRHFLDRYREYSYSKHKKQDQTNATHLLRHQQNPGRIQNHYKNISQKYWRHRKMYFIHLHNDIINIQSQSQAFDPNCGYYLHHYTNTPVRTDATATTRDFWARSTDTTLTIISLQKL